MQRPLPSLTGLRAFEAVARLGGVAQAAAHLRVTQTAISHQLSRLEEQLGLPLFRRQGRKLKLTLAGEALFPPARIAFEQLRRAVDRLHAVERPNVLTVSTLPSFATKWLVPRLAGFQARAPEVDARITTSSHAVDFAAEEVDVAVRFGRGNWPGTRADRLFSEDIQPVCAPRLLAGEPPLREPADLARHTLLHVSPFDDDWRLWLTAAGLGHIDPRRGLSFDLSINALQAAMDGLGVAIGHSAFVARDLAAGRLVAPFALKVPMHAAYYVVAPLATAERPKVKAFRDWLLDEAAETPSG
ncbi:MAG: transcriptional regulator GcvA [Alphaproteobacteria bacterium]|nr:transcriptional regulator GcvA [Alphaproteobacteria bacterium]